MCLSKAVWASFGDPWTSWKETINIASHCFYSCFLANGPLQCNINCTELMASLPITRSQITTPIIIYTSYLVAVCAWREGTLWSLFCYCLFFFLVVEELGRSGPAALNGSLPVVSLEPLFHKVYLSLSPIQWTDILAHILIPADNVSEWPTESVLCEQAIPKSTGEKGKQFFPRQ